MVQIDLIYEGNLRVEAIHLPSKNKLITDAPIDNHGKGESFSPTDLVATALGSCMMTIMGIVAERHKIDLKGTQITVKKHMINEPIRRIGKIEVYFKISGKIEEEEQKLLKNAAMSCPVFQSLHPEVEKEIRFEWGK